MNKNQILNLLAWLFLGIGIVLLIWYIFGNSPLEIYVFLPFLFTLIFKFWKISNDFSYLRGDYTTFKDNTKESFQKVKEDISKIKTLLKRK